MPNYLKIQDSLKTQAELLIDEIINNHFTRYEIHYGEISLEQQLELDSIIDTFASRATDIIQELFEQNKG